MELTEYEWSGQQIGAIDQVQAWLANPRAPQVFRVFGWAGTGKTTLAKYLASSVKGLVLYACFTGKAAMVLRKKGCGGASTIHSLIYRPVLNKSTGLFRFELTRDTPLAIASLLVVDEVSMVGEELAKDLLSFGCRILVLGDPFQLPPIKGEGFFTQVEPDVMLTEIHRQAEENPIVKLSADVRNGLDLREGEFGESRVIVRDDLTDEMLLEADQVLCGMNRTRQRLNQKIRDLRGLAGRRESWHPIEGDRLVCLRNNRDKGLLNGGLWEVMDVSDGRFLHMDLKSLDMDEKFCRVTVPEEFFSGEERNLHWRTKLDYDQFTFGWALTVHKAQGSEWDSPLLIDESSSFGNAYKNWLYTGLTRASERITAVLP